MKSKNCILLVLTTILISTGLKAEKNSDSVRKLNQMAEEAFYFENYRKAIDLYYKLDSLDPEGHSYYSYQIGLSYLYSNLDNYQAIPNIQDGESELSQGNMADVLYYHLGRAYHQDYQFDKAIENYKKAQEIIENFDARGLEFELQRQIEVCNFAKEIYSNPVNVKVKDAGTAVNTTWPDYKPVVTGDESMMFFTSRKPGSTGEEEDETGRYYEDIYVSERDAFGYWGYPNHISDKINTDVNEATVGLSSDGTELFIYKGRKKGGDIYVSTFKGNEWTDPVYVEGDANSKGWEPSASISADKRTMFFSSNRKKGKGNLDIYQVDKDENGNWGEAKNLGDIINTPYDETTPFIHPDGKTLYFSSKGHNTMGGFDIFKSILENGVWSTPINMGYPINTTCDDFHFVTNANGKRGYFSSARTDGLGEQDIYSVDLLDEETPLLLVRGNIITEGTTVGEANTKISIIDKTTNKPLNTVYQPNSETGKYLIILPPNKNYDMIVQADGFTPYQTSLEMPNLNEFHEVYQQTILRSLSNGKGQEIVVQNLFDDARNPINNDTTLSSHASKNNKDYIKIVTENLVNQLEQSGANDFNSIGDDNLALIDKILEMTDPVAEELKGNQNNDALVAEVSESSTYVYEGDNPKKGLVPYTVNGETIMVVPSTYEETATIEGEVADASSGTSEGEETAEMTKGSKDNVGGKDTGSSSKGSSSSSSTGSGSSTTAEDDVISPEEDATHAYIVKFGFDKYVLDQKYLNDIETAYVAYKKYPNAYIEIAGHTDSRGPKEYNLALSKRRSEIVAKYLQEKGIPKEKIKVKYFGESKPAAPNTNPDGTDSPAGRALNRRTEIKIFKQ